MKTTKMRINVDQTTAIREGKNQYGTTVIDINPADLTPEQRATLAASWMEYDRENGLTIPYPQRDFSDLPKIGEATIETARIILDAHAAAKIKAAREAAEKKVRDAAEKKQRHENTITQILGETDDWLSDHIEKSHPAVAPNYYRGFYIHYEGTEVVTDPRLAEKMDRAIALRDIRDKERAAREKKEAEERADLARAEAEKDARKKQQIADWVAAKGTDNQKKRAALNLLPQDEVLNALRDEAFAPLAAFARYEKITKSDVPCHCEDCDEPKIKFSTNTETEATAEDFDRMEQIQAALSGAVLTLRWHRGYCETCSDPEDDSDGVFERHSIRVAITAGEFDFTREYAV